MQEFTKRSQKKGMESQVAHYFPGRKYGFTIPITRWLCKKKAARSGRAGELTLVFFCFQSNVRCGGHEDQTVAHTMDCLDKAGVRGVLFDFLAQAGLMAGLRRKQVSILTNF